MEIGHLVSNAKESAGCSVRGLAADAHVAGSTITRIQSGTVDPTMQTVERILSAAGYDLRFEAVRHGSERRPRLGDLADAWGFSRGRLRLSWTRWRGLLDQLALHPERTPEAIYVTPPPAGDRVVDALLAAVAEKLADDAGLPRPSWTFTAPILEEPFRPPTVHTSVELKVPPQLAARGLMIDTGSLWRDRETVGV